MTEEVRTRIRLDNLRTGSFTRSAIGYSNASSSFAQEDYIQDVVCRPARQGKPLTIQRNRILSGWISGNAIQTRVYNQWLPAPYRDANSPKFQAHTANPQRPTDSALLTKLIVSANPESGKTNFPLFMFELRELPRLLKETGQALVQPLLRSVIGTGARTYLGYNFGWKPLVKDLGAMLTCLESIEARARLHRELYNKGGKTFKRQLFAGRMDSVYLGRPTIHSTGGTIMYSNEYRESTTSKVWGYAEFRPSSEPPISSKELFRHAWNTYHSLKYDPATLWNAMPWSWFIDYFLNVGDFIAANYGSYHFRLHDYALMEDLHTVFRGDVYASTRSELPGSSIYTYRNSYVSRRRWKPPLSIDTNFDTPILSGYQTSILGSLATARLFK